jgi:hypothetical protein
MSGAFVSVHGFDQALPPPPEIQVRGCSTAPWDRDGKSSAASRIALALGEPRRRANTTFRRSMVTMGQEGRHGPSCRGAHLVLHLSSEEQLSMQRCREQKQLDSDGRCESWSAAAGRRRHGSWSCGRMEEGRELELESLWPRASWSRRPSPGEGSCSLTLSPRAEGTKRCYALHCCGLAGRRGACGH